MVSSSMVINNIKLNDLLVLLYHIYDRLISVANVKFLGFNWRMTCLLICND